jgi:hypothetical protein
MVAEVGMKQRVAAQPPTGLGMTRAIPLDFGDRGIQVNAGRAWC